MPKTSPGPERLYTSQCGPHRKKVARACSRGWFIDIFLYISMWNTDFYRFLTYVFNETTCIEDLSKVSVLSRMYLP